MLDANMASFIIRGANPALRERLNAIPVNALCLSAVTEGELLYGLALKPGAARLKKAVMDFLHHPEILAWDSDAAARYGTLRADLEKAGTPLGNLDTMIAAHALAADVALVTNDRAFGRVQGLGVEDWTV
jgi:tRNA(fMet)-specific endonuclease VapC